MNSLTKFGKMFHLDVWTLALERDPRGWGPWRWELLCQPGWGLGVGTGPTRLGALALKRYQLGWGPWR